MHGMALLLLLAQRDQSQNFPADCQMHSDEHGCASMPTVADLRAHYPSREPIILILHMFPIWGIFPESSVVMAHLSHTTPSTCQWWCSHHLVLLYHLNHLNAWEVGQLFLQLPIPPASSSVLQNRPVMLRRRYAAFFGCMVPYTTTRVVPSVHVPATYPN